MDGMNRKRDPVCLRVDGGAAQTLDGRRDGPSAKALMQLGEQPIPLVGSGVGFGAEITASGGIGARQRFPMPVNYFQLQMDSDLLPATLKPFLPWHENATDGFGPDHCLLVNNLFHV